jgi:hypothetical protein
MKVIVFPVSLLFDQELGVHHRELLPDHFDLVSLLHIMHFRGRSTDFIE